MGVCEYNGAENTRRMVLSVVGRVVVCPGPSGVPG
jgi:hypothetical protein